MSASRIQLAVSVGGIIYECALAGRHQIENATAAILACRDLNVPTPAIQIGPQHVRWPGRLEFVSRNPDFVLDGAHNPAGATALASLYSRISPRPSGLDGLWRDAR